MDKFSNLVPFQRTGRHAGRLVAPFADIAPRRAGYVALIPCDADKTASLTAFADWLVAEGRHSKLVQRRANSAKRWTGLQPASLP